MEDGSARSDTWELTGVSFSHRLGGKEEAVFIAEQVVMDAVHFQTVVGCFRSYGKPGVWGYEKAAYTKVSRFLPPQRRVTDSVSDRWIYLSEPLVEIRQVISPQPIVGERRPRGVDGRGFSNENNDVGLNFFFFHSYFSNCIIVFK